MRNNTQLIESINAARGFINRSQLATMVANLKGEEGAYFADKLVEMATTFETMPRSYQQDGKGDQAVAYLHYFLGAADWYITERDIEAEQLQAFGLCNLGYGAELGYVSIVELIANNVELDLHFKPTTLAEIQAKRETAAA